MEGRRGWRPRVNVCLEGGVEIERGEGEGGGKAEGGIDAVGRGGRGGRPGWRGRDGGDVVVGRSWGDV